jgi:polyvinyl alcohol dehydrogenase (cytochrome)
MSNSTLRIAFSTGALLSHRRRAWLFFAALLAGHWAYPGVAQTSKPPQQEPRLSGGRPVIGPPAGVTIFQQKCANCHTSEGLRMGGRAVPSIAALKAMPPNRIYESITRGSMTAEAAGLDDRLKRDLAEFLTDRPFIDVEGTGAARMANRCATNPALGDLSSTPSWNGWSPDLANSRFQPAAAARLAPSDVPRLGLKWAFGFPGGGSSMSQPTVALGRVFVASDNRALYAIDARTGCVYWSFHPESSGRIAPIVAPATGHPGTRYAVYFVTGSATAYAVDAQDGKLLWKTEIKGLQVVSAAAAYHEGRLYIPLTGSETVSGSNPDYECCRSRGGVAALATDTGRIVWKVDSLPEALKRLGVNKNGKTLWGPSGAGVWNTPTIDPKRRRIYVGTGNNYGPIASDSSDSILALSMDDGHILWKHQEIKGDAFMLGCGDTNPPGGNCPETIGQDWDFGGASAILRTLSNGHDVLAAAGKAGIAIALNPADGSLLWRTRLFVGQPPTADGLVIFGGAADGERVYFPLQQPGGGIAALQLATGKIDWTAGLNTDARGQIGAASAIPGVVFTGGWDGILRALDTKGRVIWTYDTRRDFSTVNGVPAKGGSLGSPGPTIADGMLYAVSGYIGMQNGSPGNVLLAFSVH